MGSTTNEGWAVWGSNSGGWQGYSQFLPYGYDEQWHSIPNVSLTTCLDFYALQGNVLLVSLSATAAPPAHAPGPIVGAGLPGLIAACGGLLALARRRRQQIV
jgi:hypothetical protein